MPPIPRAGRLGATIHRPAPRGLCPCGNTIASSPSSWTLLCGLGPVLAANNKLRSLGLFWRILLGKLAGGGSWGWFGISKELQLGENSTTQIYWCLIVSFNPTKRGFQLKTGTTHRRLFEGCIPTIFPTVLGGVFRPVQKQCALPWLGCVHSEISGPGGMCERDVC